MEQKFTLAALGDEHLADYEQLLRRSFGPARFVRMAERLRENNTAQPALSYGAFAVPQKKGEQKNGQAEMIGAISYWPIWVGSDAGLLLGPLVVSPDTQNCGIGRALMAHTLEIATTQGHDFILLIGDLPYYESAGFQPAPTGLACPAPVDNARTLWRQLTDKPLTLKGQVAPRKG